MHNAVFYLSYHSTAGELRTAHYQFPLLQRCSECPGDHVPREYFQYLPAKTIYGCSMRSVQTRSRLCVLFYYKMLL